MSDIEKKALPKGGLTWFEVSTADITRAVSFYEAVLAECLIDVGHDEPMYMFPLHDGAVTGALIRRPGRVPSAAGVLVYLHIHGPLADAMARVAPAGGQLVTGAMVVDGVAGTFCVIEDTEGNHIGIHAIS
ncbi:lactoylglutathione lyase family protein [Terriglobus roseus DSM 18391]|uniref:Lactoylglutathione lyase family protein n=1 Tax=Terriglobus roseus (strain DSM 18391 / NRRL B-41598 / KBS 63) TaxID=926566 RepID=I3ZCI0_TERRK|nr:lactoylglutathione lyase family protein [Terriglobus roseus]AFL86948.1 lactoylglutathione lyase family protein [Terriglobus roseus DSM 18391]